MAKKFRKYGLNDPVNFVDPTGLTKEDVRRAIEFVRAYNPSVPGFSYTIRDLGNGVSGQAEPSLIPGINRQILIDDRYLDNLNNQQLKDLLNTVYHEAQHLKDGFYGSAIDMITGQFLSRHNQIFENSNKFTDKFIGTCK